MGLQQFMSATGSEKNVKKTEKKEDALHPSDPDWSSGLKRLYDSVVDEPLPDSFKDLLSKLDDDSSK